MGGAGQGPAALGRANRRRGEVEAVADAVRGLLDDAELSLPGHRLVSLRHRRTVSRREVKTGFFVAEMSFRAVVE